VDIRLADVITSLRSELDRARAASEGHETRFVVESVDIQVEVALEKSGQANGGVEFWVVSLGAEGSRTTRQTTTLNLHLTVESATGERIRTADDITTLISTPR